MDKLLIVDDEEIEREGIAGLIDWSQYGIEMVGTAWNGLDGLEKMEQLRPDIVLADIKMPGMDGLEMIRQARPRYPDTIFVILSGYGEYEFTSQAMQEGIRHYILKPCDEEKITAVLRKVQDELEQQRMKNAQAHRTRMLLPRAKEQIFRDMLLYRVELSATAPQQLVAELGGLERQVLALSFRLEGGFDYMEQFIIGNMMTDLLPEGTLLLSAEVRTDLFLLVDASAADTLEGAVARLRKEFRAFQSKPLRSAASHIGTLEQLPRLYEQAEELLYLADLEGLECLLRCGQEEQPAAHLVDYQAIRDADSYEGILFGLHLACLKLRLMGRGQEDTGRYFTIVWKMLAGDAPVPKITLESFADALAARKGLSWDGNAKGRSILLAAYKHINDPNVSLQTLAKEELFMNEEHLGRLFSKLTGKRFSAFVEARRMEQAKQILRFQPDMKISALAELVGYPADGQYFSKAFHKVFGMSPREYRDSL